MLIHDSAAATARDLTPEGFLHVQARIARAGLHNYQASELGVPDGFDPHDTIRVYRPPEEVFDPASMASFTAKPVTDDHPPTMIDAKNWKRYAIGQSGAVVTRDGDHLATDLLITDADAVRRAQNGAQLSNGYHADFDFVAGTTPEGEPYDAVQRTIRGNHIALVDAGRCGETCRVGDGIAVGDCGCLPSVVVVTIDGIAIEATPSGVEALARLKSSVEAKDGAIAALAAKVPDAAAIEALVTERATVTDAARSALGEAFDVRGKTTPDIRRAVVVRLLGTSLDGRSDAYVAAVFDTLLAARASSNPLAIHLASSVRDTCGSSEAARRGRDRFLAQAWKGEPTPGVS